MQSKTFALIALSASAALASPFHKRASLHHHRLHGTGSHSVRPSGTAGLFPAGNDTNGFFPPTGGMTFVSETQTETQVITMTVNPLPAGSVSVSVSTPASFGNAATGVDASSSSSCVTTSIATETSINLVTVTASLQAKAVEAGSVSPGAFYGQSKSWGGGWGYSNSAPAVSQTGHAASTTFATMPSASKSFGASGSASASASASAPASNSSSSSGSSGGKRGISFNDASLVSAFGNSVSWAYNWGTSKPSNLGCEFVPMMWGSGAVSGFASNVGSATHVLSLNEPDLSTQSNLDPKTAASLHKQGMQSLVGKVQIGSPAITNGQSSSPPMGTTWLDQFFQDCGTDCPVDFVAYHWYGSASSINDFKSHTQDVINVAKKYGVSRVWLTEFAPDGDAASQASFMQEAVNFLDSNGAVERYAAFMASDGTLLSGSKLNSVGSAYVAAS